MDEGGQRENERHKIDQYKSIHAQWMGPQHHLKDNQSVKIIVAEREKAFQERDLALAEKKAAVVERDMAILQRDSAIAERNTAIMERDNAIAALEYARENGVCPNCGPGAQRRTKHVYHQQQHHLQHIHPQPSQLSDAPYNPTRETQYEGFHMPTTSENGAKSPKTKRPRKDTKAQPSALKNPTKAPRKSKKGGNDNLNKQVTIAKGTGDWRTQVGVGEDLNKQVSVSKHQQWKTQDLGLNEVTFDDSMMPSPVCSCTGKYQQCYKWGNGGWQSACCTMTLSMYPLPQMPNKRHARVGGRKMSGSAFRKLLSRLAADGHDLSLPVDLKDHWAKHGTNRYITIK